jgi:hypothetical protein
LARVGKRMGWSTAPDWSLAMGSFRLLHRLRCGDVETMYLSVLGGGGTGTDVVRPRWFAMKVMDKASLESRTQTEREIFAATGPVPANTVGQALPGTRHELHNYIS